MKAEEVLREFMPEGILEEFDIGWVEKRAEDIVMHLDEKAIVPALSAEQKLKGVYSKGFTEAIDVLDFPIRGRACHLKVRKRKWKVNGEETVLMRSIDITRLGTKFAKDFADFLKETGGA